MTRIVGGRFGGRRIAAPHGQGTRPTTDRVREAMFNVLAAQWDFDGVTVLDLYAGSGALGLEALSRGAVTATFVEADRRAADVIAANARTLAAAGVAVRCGDVASVLAAGADRPVDLVFADPPYDVAAADVAAVLTTLGERGWVLGGATAVVERSTSGPELDWPVGWTGRQVRRYGDTRLEFGEFA